MVGLSFAAVAASACSNGTVHDSPDATLSWASHDPMVSVPEGGLGLVSNNGSSEVSLLDLGGATTIGNVRVGIDPIANNGPHHLAVDPLTQHVFVALAFPPPGIPSGPHAGHGSSLVPGWVQMLALSDMHEIARHEIDPNPGDIVLTPDGRRIIVSHFNLAQTMDVLASGGTLMDAYSNLWVLDATTLDRIASFPVCVMAHGIAVAPDSDTVYVACEGQDSLGITRLSDPMHAVELVPVGPGASTVPAVTYGPYALLITRDLNYVVVSNYEAQGAMQGLRVFDINAHAFDIHKSVLFQGASFFGTESPDQQYLFIPTQGPDTIVRVRLSDWRTDMQVPVPSDQCILPHEISLGPDGKYYLVCEAVGTDTTRQHPSHVVTFDPVSLQLTGHFDVGIYPDRVVFVPGPGQDGGTR